MLASATAIWVIVIVVVLCLATWLTAVALAARRPYWKHATKRPMIGPVVGAIHYADGGRSVAPDREAPPVFTEEEDRLMRRAATGKPPIPPRPRVPGQPVPGQRVTSPAPAPRRAGSIPAGSAADEARRPVSAPEHQMPTQRRATQDQPEHHRRA